MKKTYSAKAADLQPTWYVIDAEGQVLGPGDFVRAEAGTHHHEVISLDGCTALLILGPTLAEYERSANVC